MTCPRITTSTREPSIDAAIDVLAEEGARGLTYRAVDAKAGVPAGTASNYFASRDDLMSEVAVRVTERLVPSDESIAESLALPRDKTLTVKFMHDIVKRADADKASYLAMMDLLRDVATPSDEGQRAPPATVTILSGDVHFSFRSRASFIAGADDVASPVSRIHQIVNSPLRNVLATRERRVLRAGLSRVGEVVGRMLRRSVGARPDRSRWSVEDGPFFANHICLLEFREREARMLLERAEPDDEGRPTLTVAAESKL